MSPLKAIDADTNESALSFKLSHSDKTRNFVCPACNAEMLLVLPKKKIIKHFRHKTGNAHGENETIAHLNAKHIIMLAAQKSGFEVDVEHYIKEYGEIHVIDVLIKMKNKTYAVECQHSGISTEEIDKRNAFFRKHGMIPKWVFVEGKTYKPRKRNGHNEVRLKKSELHILKKTKHLEYILTTPARVTTEFEFATREHGDSYNVYGDYISPYTVTLETTGSYKNYKTQDLKHLLPEDDNI